MQIRNACQLTGRSTNPIPRSMDRSVDRDKLRAISCRSVDPRLIIPLSRSTGRSTGLPYARLCTLVDRGSLGRPRQTENNLVSVGRPTVDRSFAAVDRAQSTGLPCARLCTPVDRAVDRPCVGLQLTRSLLASDLCTIFSDEFKKLHHNFLSPLSLQTQIWTLRYYSLMMCE